MPKFMRVIKRQIYCIAAGFLGLCAALTGCAKKETEFFQEEIQSTELSEETQQEAGNEETDAELLTEPSEIYVDVCGAVAKPGVFQLEEGSRVFQAIEAAGGYLPEAAQEGINKAGFLNDGQQIYVPTKEETMAADGKKWEETGSGGGSETAFGGKVNLNTATEEELTTLTGIGATRARAIISYREENGPFAVIEDIMKVQGIKEGTFEKIKDEIIVG